MKTEYELQKEAEHEVRENEYIFTVRIEDEKGNMREFSRVLRIGCPPYEIANRLSSLASLIRRAYYD